MVWSVVSVEGYLLILLEKVMKKVLTLVSSLLLVAATQTYADGIAVVDVQQMFEQSPKIADFNKKLQDQFKGRQQKLVAQQKALQEEVDNYKKEEPTMNQKQKESLQKKIAGDQSALSKDAAAFQEALSKEQSKTMKNVSTQLKEIIADIAKKNNYSVVLDGQAVIYKTDAVDITKQVSTEFDKK
jgi:outer membrane protein